MNLDGIWRSLESGGEGQTPEHGVTVRRIDPGSADGLFAGIRRNTGTRLLLIQTAALPRPDEGSLIQSQGFTTAVNRFSGDAGRLHLFIESANRTFNEVFSFVAGAPEEAVSGWKKQSGKQCVASRLIVPHALFRA